MVAENRNNCIGATHRYLHTDPIERGFCCRCPPFVAYRHSNWFLLVIFIRTFDYDTIGCCVRYTVFACLQMSWYVFKFLFIFVCFFSSYSLCRCYSFIFLWFCLSHHLKFIYYWLVGWLVGDSVVVVVDGFSISFLGSLVSNIRCSCKRSFIAVVSPYMIFVFCATNMCVLFLSFFHCIRAIYKPVCGLTICELLLR